MYENELMHYGVKGMKWGVRQKTPLTSYSKRIVRGHSGPAIMLTKKRQYAADKRDLETLNNGGHLSYGVGKKRQAAYDARDRKIIEKRIADYESGAPSKKAVAKERKRKIKDTYREVRKNTSFGEKLLFNEATQKRAATYMVDHNMNMSDAKKRANKDAIRNTTVLLGAIGTYAIANSIKNR